VQDSKAWFGPGPYDPIPDNTNNTPVTNAFQFLDWTNTVPVPQFVDCTVRVLLNGQVSQRNMGLVFLRDLSTYPGVSGFSGYNQVAWINVPAGSCIGYGKIQRDDPTYFGLIPGETLTDGSIPAGGFYIYYDSNGDGKWMAYACSWGTWAWFIDADEELNYYTTESVSISHFPAFPPIGTNYILGGVINVTVGSDTFPTETNTFVLTTNNSSTTITAYNGTNQQVSIPPVIAGLSVTAIGDNAFLGSDQLSSVSIPSSITNIGLGTFAGCTMLTNVTIPGSVMSIGDHMFANCWLMSSLYFGGNAPCQFGSSGANWQGFNGDTNLTIYYLPGATGWGATYGGVPTVLWNPHTTNDGRFGMCSNQFWFTVCGTSNISCVIESCTNLCTPYWLFVTNITLSTGSCRVCDKAATNRAMSFYRFRSP
jgi:hypothetical protein